MGDSVEDAAAQTRAERTHVFARGNEFLDDGIRVLIFDVVRHAGRFEVLFHRRGGAARDVLVDVYGDEVKMHGSTGLEFPEDFQQDVTVFAAAHRDRNFVTLTDHAVVGNCLGGEAHDAFFELSHRNGRVHMVAVGRHDVLFVVVAAFDHAAVFKPVDRRFFRHDECPKE